MQTPEYVTETIADRTVECDRDDQNKLFISYDRKLVEAPPPPPPSNFIVGRPKAALLFCLLLVVLLARCIPVVFIVYICLIRILALRPPVLQFQLPALLLVCVLFVLFLLFVVVLSGEPRQKQGRELVDHKLVEAPPPVIYIAGRLFCFGSLVILDVARCYLWLLTLYINIKIGKNSCYMLD